MMDEIKLRTGKPPSVKSMRSIKTVKSVTDCSEEKAMDLDEFLSMACKKFPCPCKFIVKKEGQVDEYAKMMKQEGTGKSKRMSMAPAYGQRVPPPPPPSPPEAEKDQEDTSITTAPEEGALTITAFYDSANRLAEIFMQNMRVPRMLIQLIGLIAPHYPQLSKIMLKNCRIDPYTIHEMQKFIPLTTITEICLDDSPIHQGGDYALLLGGRSKIANLSLSRCQIDDEGCQLIAVKLQYMESAEASLTTLNLSSNRITDVGAKYIGEALRTNRHLRHLNLSDNRIGDEGAYHIFQVLMDFQLTYDEIRSKRHRLMSHLRAKQAVYLKYLADAESSSLDEYSLINKKIGKKSIVAPNVLKSKPKKEKKSIVPEDEFSHVRAEIVANEAVGPLTGPYLPGFTKAVDGYCHSIGNMVLCHLNLAYNNLSYISLKKLQAVLFYQSVNKKSTQTGLMRVNIDGNNLPVYCNELERTGEMLHRNVVNFSAKYMTNKLKARARISVIPERK